MLAVQVHTKLARRGSFCKTPLTQEYKAAARVEVLRRLMIYQASSEYDLVTAPSLGVLRARLGLSESMGMRLFGRCLFHLKEADRDGALEPLIIQYRPEHLKSIEKITIEVL